MKFFIKFICYKIIDVILKFETKISFNGVAYFILKWEATRNYRYFMHKDINWNDPTDLNEKINWLKFHSESKRWSDLTDKYKLENLLRKNVSKIFSFLYMGCGIRLKILILTNCLHHLC